MNHLQAYFNSGATRSVTWRKNQLLALRNLLKVEEEKICDALNKDLGKSRTESYLTEVNFLVLEIDHALGHLKQWMKRKKVSSPVFMLPAESFIQYEPLGVVLIMGAWNYPVQLTLGPLIPAIAAGNCAVVKAPRTASRTFDVLAELIPKYMDKEGVHFVDKDTSNETLLSRAWGKIFLTGSGRIGKIVMKAASETLTPVTLELGGKSPAIFTESCDLKVGMRRMLQGKYTNAGQTCVAPDYVLLKKGMWKDFLKTYHHVLKEFFGPDIEKSADYGRIINEKNFNHLLGLLDGHSNITGGNSNPDTLYLEPTMVLNPNLDSDLMQEEIFGPILPVLEYDSLQDAIDFVNSKDKPLALYVFSELQSEINEVLSKTSSGGVCINECLYHLAVPDLPFGGVGPSGMGSYHGFHGFLDFSNEKSVVQRKTNFDPSLRYPPFEGSKSAKIKALMNLQLPSWMLKSKLVSNLSNMFGGWFLK